MDENVVDIYDISYEGAGVGRINNQIVFVPKTLKNEKVRVKIVKRHSSFLIGKIDGIIKQSEKRIDAKCQHFSVCGGCDFQHCDSDEEKKIKIGILKKELSKAGYVGDVDFVEAERRFGYRNKIKLEVRDGKLGFFKAKTRDFFEVERCEIASEKINQILPVLKKFVAENKLTGLSSVYLKQVEEKVAICFLFPKNFEKTMKNVKNLGVFDGFSVFFAFGDVLESNSTKVFHIFGDGKLIKKFGEIEIAIDVSSFNQINDEIAEKLYEFVEKFCENKRVVNAYSGQGFLTYLIAQRAKFVYGIEYQKASHQAAERLCAMCDGYKTENICGKVEDCLKTVLLKDRIDVIVLDPAREGCDKRVLDAIVAGGLDSVIYVSCNFATLVRDLKVLGEFYDVEMVKIFNMFPCCVNMETVAVLKRKS